MDFGGARTALPDFDAPSCVLLRRFLSFAAHWILVQVSGGIFAQILVSVLGIVLLVGIAWLATWYRSLPMLFAVPETSESDKLEFGPKDRASL
ncbi:OpgC domain-containing protein [Bradyrhizobium sp. BEA-2-5]|uniref:OpgC domain-containing protein n=1 Tax=Bradyrhizobium TaxID=374 RepID=UPI00067E426A|nr:MULTISPECIES: OpgC domain-containing protein [Bradyrhizobium]WOH83820.1 OpgC domain-containing protein [Bradyrhizobium sp. BEA-2-5]